ncbi:MAG: sel1 repeat family protein, partial [Desulfovibrionaceae bacterium]|nr:sel1 repeat family protein [Desulfovibrionaceae bacterium]
LRMAREHLRGQADPALSLALAQPLRHSASSAEEADAAFLLLEDAAQKGNPEAMLLVGQFYDPTSTLPRGSIPVDMSQARHWYRQAGQKGQPGAAEALQALRARVQEEADKGNAEARLLLRQWPQGE